MPERSIVNLMDGTQKPLPVLAVSTGTFEAANRVANIRPRIYPGNQYKIKLSIDLFEANVDEDALSEKINSVKTENITPRMFQYNCLSQQRLQRVLFCRKAMMII